MSRGQIAVTFAVLMSTAFAWSPAAGPAGAAPDPVVGKLPPRYTGTPITGPENVTFLYHSLPEAEAAGQLANIGHPRDLVFGNKNTGPLRYASGDGEATVAAVLRRR